MTRQFSGFRTSWLLAVPISMLALAPIGARDAVAHYTAFAVDVAGPQQARTETGVVDITIERWSTDAENQKLSATLAEKGSDKLLDVLQDLPTVGKIHPPGAVGFDIHYARRTVDADKSEHVTVITDRPIQLWETRSGSRTTQYPYTLVALHVGPDGKGEGKLSVASNIVYDQAHKILSLERFNDQPVRLTNVQRLDD